MQVSHKTKLILELLGCFALTVIATRISTALMNQGSFWGDVSYFVVLLAFLAIPVICVRKIRKNTDENAGLTLNLCLKDILKGLAVVAILLVPVCLGAWFWNVHIQGATFRFDWANYDKIDGSILMLVLTQLLLVAFPEEYFYRGYLQTGWNQVFANKQRGKALSILLTSLLFGIGHVLASLNPVRMNVFFPSLLFGALRTKCKGIGGCIVLHACCNLMVQLFFVHFQFR